MATLYNQKDSNTRKTWFLMTMFLLLVIALGFVFSLAFNSPSILYTAVFISLFMNVLAYWKSDSIALAMSGAVLAPPERFIELHRIVENLAITAGLPKPRVYIIPGMQINAFATGKNPENSAIAVTEGALMKLNKNEMEGVLAHELSHIGNRDILISSVAVVLGGVIAILADIFLRSMMWGGDSDNKGNALTLGIALVAAILAPIAATIIRLAVSRKREFLADASGALLTRYPEGLASALEKISVDQDPLKKARTGTAHLFIANPFKGKGSKKSWFAGLFMTHPPVEERIAILREMRSQ